MQLILPTLNPGEINAGLIMNANGTASHWLILLPGDKNDGNWHDAKTWAKEQGGELPTRNEQSLLFANAKPEFKSDWYWSGEPHAENSEWAWFQHFSYGGQYGSHKSNDDCRARAVRRISVI
ncbi:hypothetical protein Q9292_10005 [Methylophilus sp. VKM B-3414]|uniref:hypothetical protein n=1 Tax=Methylophilus sp. VKM B-3414 TaxID=3076121 RepID=UPI0028CB08C3|nr:hypothetical protein [Methylophilus sp. VKM B-3414]MDT7849944.1 hypothetical protein [Methylophilus sp. VKM B-3414]